MSTLEVKVGSRVLGEIEVTTDYDNYTDWLKTLSQDNIDEVIIDSGAAKGISQPVIVHSKNKSKSDKTSAA